MTLGQRILGLDGRRESGDDPFEVLLQKAPVLIQFTYQGVGSPPGQSNDEGGTHEDQQVEIA